MADSGKARTMAKDNPPDAAERAASCGCLAVPGNRLGDPGRAETNRRDFADGRATEPTHQAGRGKAVGHDQPGNRRRGATGSIRSVREAYHEEADPGRRWQ